MTITAEEKLAIHELLSRAYLALDTHDVSGWAAAFVPDGVFAAYDYEFNGTTAITDFIKQHIAKGAEEGARHLVTNLLITEEDGKVAVYGYITKIKIDKMPAETVAFAGLKGFPIKRDGEWRFARLNLVITLTAPSVAKFKGQA
jgi:hypothetical protein